MTIDMKKRTIDYGNLLCILVGNYHDFFPFTENIHERFVKQCFKKKTHEREINGCIRTLKFLTKVQSRTLKFIHSLPQ